MPQEDQITAVTKSCGSAVKWPSTFFFCFKIRIYREKKNVLKTKFQQCAVAAAQLSLIDQHCAPISVPGALQRPCDLSQQRGFDYILTLLLSSLNPTVTSLSFVPCSNKHPKKIIIPSLSTNTFCVPCSSFSLSVCFPYSHPLIGDTMARWGTLQYLCQPKLTPNTHGHTHTHTT